MSHVFTNNKRSRSFTNLYPAYSDSCRHASKVPDGSGADLHSDTNGGHRASAPNPGKS